MDSRKTKASLSWQPPTGRTFWTPALMRPGRFDRQIYVGTPDVQGRQDILKIYARDKRLDEQVDLEGHCLGHGPVSPVRTWRIF